MTSAGREQSISWSGREDDCADGAGGSYRASRAGNLTFIDEALKARLAQLEFDGSSCKIAVRVVGWTAWTDGAIVLRSRTREFRTELARVGSYWRACVPLRYDNGRFAAVGIPVGGYDVEFECVDATGTVRRIPLLTDPSYVAGVPHTHQDGLSEYRGLVSKSGCVHLSVRAALSPDERGAFHQRRLQESTAATVVKEADLDGLLLRSYFAETVTCNGLAITEELLRRGSTLPIYWAVRDESVWSPPGVERVLHNSARWYELLRSAKYYIDNMYQPAYHDAPPGQVVVETFHGYPFKAMGHGYWTTAGFSAEQIESYDKRAEQWSYLVSPAPYATPYLTKEFAYDGEVLEIGYPRNDVLRSERADTLRAEVRSSLGIAEGERVVLFAPTFRDWTSVDGHTAPFVDTLDVRHVAELLGDGARLLVRGHAFNARSGQSRRFGANVIDVTAYPEVSDLYLAADVAVVDYSSLRFDFGVTGKPMIFLVPDLEQYKQGRGWLFDFEPTAPGPFVSTGDEVAELVRTIDTWVPTYARAYASFTDGYLSLEDGHAARRFVDAVFVPRGDAPALEKA
ncbi:hypothetical protein GCM10025864_28740 [Luteimicrobium album]|uniref:Uncharacterized protein n=1 Tax=Luteimicrobium album TaxID=1054550 RepID=A0ABQ6I3N6_9MICO|nr:CDP-glycerol glycerophosphotransferase family protein [Luteimicrobium album]GMA25115.1 hypothetical protein GCM10025864_28740 [Luteimicrobium album]